MTSQFYLLKDEDLKFKL